MYRASYHHVFSARPKLESSSDVGDRSPTLLLHRSSTCVCRSYTVKARGGLYRVLPDNV